MHRTCRLSVGRRLALGAPLATLLLIGIAPPLLAVDTPSNPSAPDLTAVRAKIKAKDWPAAIGDLNALVEQGVQQADVYSLLGFSLRKRGDYEKAYTFYRKALEFEPNHKGALEYLGELYVERGQMAKAREHVSLLTRLCPNGCEAYIPHSRRARLCAPPPGGWATWLDRKRRSLLRAIEGFATAPALGGRQIA
jgi:tetratricopeptide (TPR) repeat protein